MTLPLFVGGKGPSPAVDEARPGPLHLPRHAEGPVRGRPEGGDLYRTGTVAMIMRMLKLPDGRLKILIQGVVKAKIAEFIERSPRCVSGSTGSSSPR